MDLFPSNRVMEYQILGVQEVAAITGDAGERLQRLAACGVERIAH